MCAIATVRAETKLAKGDSQLCAVPRSVETLSLATLRGLPYGVVTPSFNPQVLRTGILHLGCGSFHRAHQAFLTQKAIEVELETAGASMAGTIPAWGIAAVSFRTPTVVRALRKQEGLFTVLERGPSTTRATVVGTVRDFVHAPTSSTVVAQAMANPTTRIVTLTVTAAGYCVDDAAAQEPRGAIGVIVAGLKARMDRGIAPPVIISCDNVPSNGRVLRQACVDQAAIDSDKLSGWIARHVQFPSTMVDRIVPSLTKDDRLHAAAALGLNDAVPVSAEPFHQWVIEHFDGARPRWDAVGAEYVGQVAPWEASKLRLLNGGHLAVASLGLLAGCDDVSHTMALPGLRAYALRYMLDEQKPTLPVSDHDIDAYAGQLIERWRNPGITHQLSRVARDGSTKIAARLLASLRDNRRARRPAPCTVMGVAAWMCGCASVERARELFVLHDPVLAEIEADLAKAARRPADLVALLLGRTEIFGDDLSRDSGLHTLLERAVSLLQHLGVAGAVAACLAGALDDRVMSEALAT